MGWRPEQRRPGFGACLHCDATDDAFRIGFEDRTAMSGMYEFQGTTRQGDHRVD